MRRKLPRVVLCGNHKRFADFRRNWENRLGFRRREVFPSDFSPALCAACRLMTGYRHLDGPKRRGLLCLAVSISYLLASPQTNFAHFSQCLWLTCFFATFDGCATFNGFADLTAFDGVNDFMGGVPN